MTRNIRIIDFVTDPQLLGLSISKPQETLLRSIYGLALTKSMLDIWQQCTGRERYQTYGFSEATIICGARSGKDSRIATPTAAFEAALGNHEKYLTKGERVVIPLIYFLTISGASIELLFPKPDAHAPAFTNQRRNNGCAGRSL